MHKNVRYLRTLLGNLYNWNIKYKAPIPSKDEKFLTWLVGLDECSAWRKTKFSYEVWWHGLSFKSLNSINTKKKQHKYVKYHKNMYWIFKMGILLRTKKLRKFPISPSGFLCLEWHSSHIGIPFLLFALKSGTCFPRTWSKPVPQCDNCKIWSSGKKGATRENESASM